MKNKQIQKMAKKVKGLKAKNRNLCNEIEDCKFKYDNLKNLVKLRDEQLMYAKNELLSVTNHYKEEIKVLDEAVSNLRTSLKFYYEKEMCDRIKNKAGILTRLYFWRS